MKIATMSNMMLQILQELLNSGRWDTSREEKMANGRITL